MKMNILNSRMPHSALPPQIIQNINQMKQMRSMFSGSPQQFIQQLSQSNPAFNQIMQMCKGKNPQQVFEALCKQRGLDSNAIINEFRK